MVVATHNWPKNDAFPGATPSGPVDARLAPFLLGRTALNHLIRLTGVENAYLPAFVCPLVVEIFLRRGCRLRFYDHLGANLRPNATTALASLDAPLAGRSLFVWVDYFGRGDDLPQTLAERCHALGIETLLDAAHGLPPRAASLDGLRADYAIYGARKTLTVPLGAFLFSRHGAIATDSALQAPALTRHALDHGEAFIDDSHAWPALATEVARRDLERIAARRRRHHDRLASRLELAKVAPHACPLGLPIVIEDRDGVRRALLEREVQTAVLWSSLHATVTAPHARSLAEHILLLPTPHDLEDAQVDHTADVVLELTAGRRHRQPQ